MQPSPPPPPKSPPPPPKEKRLSPSESLPPLARGIIFSALALCPITIIYQNFGEPAAEASAAPPPSGGGNPLRVIREESGRGLPPFGADRPRCEPGRVRGELLSDLAEIFENGPNSPYLHLETSQKESVFERMRSAMGPAGGLDGLSLSRLAAKAEDARTSYEVRGPDEKPLGVITVEFSQGEGRFMVTDVR